MTRKGKRQVPPYPWLRWFNGSAHIIERGVDFDLTCRRMRTMLTQRAAEKGLEFASVIDGDHIAFEARESRRKRLADLLKNRHVVRHMEEHARAWGLR